MAIPRFAQLQQPSVVAISNRVARYSYGIYLTHFICIWFAFQALGNLPTGARWLVFIASMSLIPIALHHTLEAPMIRLGQRVASCLLDRSREAGHRADTQAGTVFLQREDRVRSREATRWVKSPYDRSRCSGGPSGPEASFGPDKHQGASSSFLAVVKGGR